MSTSCHHHTIDLHSHSLYSDGVLSPTALVQRAFDAGVKMLALTDHDSIEGITEAVETTQALGMTLIPGVEISARWQRHAIHILALGIEVNSPELQAGLLTNQQRRVVRAQAIGQALATLGYPDTYEQTCQMAGLSHVTRAHFARYLVKKGVVPDYGRAFKRYLGRGKGAYVEIDWPDMKQVLSWIKSAGGAAVLAHPTRYQLTANQLRKLLLAFEQHGGDGIELCVPNLPAASLTKLAQFANSHELSVSQGSDFHDPEHVWVNLGKFPAMPADCTPIWQKELKSYYHESVFSHTS